MATEPTTQAAMVTSPFGGDIAASPQPEASGALVKVEEARAIQEVQAALIIGKRFPRDEKKAMDRILTACARETLAKSALYCYPKGGQEITGPSIRLAEAIAQIWGNIQFGIRELEQKDGMSTVEAFAWDVETNTRQVKVFQIRHWRHTRSGGYALEDPREIYEMTANQGARRLRACILGVIPGDVIEAATAQCTITLQQSKALSPTPENIKKMIEMFAAYGVTKEMIEARIGRRLDGIPAAILVQLGNIYNSIKEGMSGAHEWFEVPKPETASTAEEVKETLKARKAAKDATPPPAPEPEPTLDDITPADEEQQTLIN